MSWRIALHRLTSQGPSWRPSTRPICPDETEQHGNKLQMTGEMAGCKQMTLSTSLHFGWCYIVLVVLYVYIYHIDMYSNIKIKFHMHNLLVTIGKDWSTHSILQGSEKKIQTTQNHTPSCTTKHHMLFKDFKAEDLMMMYKKMTGSLSPEIPPSSAVSSFPSALAVVSPSLPPPRKRITPWWKGILASKHDGEGVLKKYGKNMVK